MNEASPPEQFTSYEQFFAFYLRAHSHPGNRILHLCGSMVGLLAVAAALLLHHPWYVLLWPVIGYAFAWFGHFVIEGNKPATFGHPWWSFISDYRMVWLMLTGKLGAYLRAAESSQSHSTQPIG